MGVGSIVDSSVRTVPTKTMVSLLLDAAAHGEGGLPRQLHADADSARSKTTLTITIIETICAVCERRRDDAP